MYVQCVSAFPLNCFLFVLIFCLISYFLHIYFNLFFISSHYNLSNKFFLSIFLSLIINLSYIFRDMNTFFLSLLKRINMFPIWLRVKLNFAKYFKLFFARGKRYKTSMKPWYSRWVVAQNTFSACEGKQIFV